MWKREEGMSGKGWEWMERDGKGWRGMGGDGEGWEGTSTRNYMYRDERALGRLEQMEEGKDKEKGRRKKQLPFVNHRAGEK